MRALPGNVLTGLNLFLVAAGLFSEIRGEAFLKNSLTVVTEANYVWRPSVFPSSLNSSSSQTSLYVDP